MYRRPPAQNSSGYLAADTIAAIASAVGGPIAVLRVSGPAAFSVVAALAPTLGTPPARQLVRARLRDAEGRPLDDALAVRFVAPASYTGEDVVELHVHGGGFVASRVLGALAAAGARQALPGEFSFRAVRNGKLGLVEAQAVSELIQAANAGAAELALEKMAGAESRVLTELAENLRTVAVFAEAGIDFSDQDLEEVAIPALRVRLAPIVAQLEALASTFARGSRVQEGVRVAFAGLPNAGKSSFFNRLLGEDRSIVSEIPGTTRDVIRERITLEGARTSVTLRLEDTAGLRGARDPIERAGIERTRQAVLAADLVLFLVDPRENAGEVRAQWEALTSADPKLGDRAIGLLTKSDLGPAESRRFSEISEWVELSALTGQGMEDAIAAITRFCERWVFRGTGELLLTRQDHLTAVVAALDHLKRAAASLAHELFASDVRQALHALGPLIGETPADDILGRIFSDFCIGK